MKLMLAVLKDEEEYFKMYLALDDAVDVLGQRLPKKGIRTVFFMPSDGQNEHDDKAARLRAKSAGLREEEISRLFP